MTKSIRRIAGAFGMWSVVWVLCADSAAGAVDVIPLPQRVTILGGDVKILAGKGMRIIVADAADELLARTAGQLRMDLQGRGIEVRDEAPISVLLGEPATHAGFAKRCGDALPDAERGPEGYRLRVSPQTIVIAGNGPAGTFYGVQTLRQLFAPGAHGGLRLPQVDISDWPAMRWRGTMRGMSREEDIARLAFCKLNFLNWEVGGSPKYDSLPELEGKTPKSHYANAAALARRYHISMILETQSFGHVSWLLRHHPELCAVKDNFHILRPLHEPTYRILDMIYANLCPLYDTPIYFAGCDEPWGIEKWAEDQGLVPADVVGKHIARLTALLKARGKKTMVWGDYLLKFPEALDHLPKEDVIICDWHYSPAKEYPSVDVFTKRGFTTLVSPAVMPAHPVFPNYARQIPNIRNMIQDGYRRGAVGLLNTNWPVDPIPTEAYWYGWVTGAEYAWNPTGRTQEEFDEVFFRRTYGVEAEDALETFAKITRLAPLRSVAKQAGRSLSEFVREYKQIVCPVQPRRDERVEEARRAVDTCRKKAGAKFDSRWASLARVPRRFTSALAHVADCEAAAKAIAGGDLAGAKSNLGRLSTSEHASGRDLARRLAAAGSIDEMCSILKLKDAAAEKTVRLDPGRFFAAEQGAPKAEAPMSRRKGMCFIRSGGAASWRVDVRTPGRYRVFALMRHSHGHWKNGVFAGGSRNASYEGKYGITINGKPVRETWIGDELDPDKDEALQWALLLDGQLRDGQHTIRMQTSGPNYAIVQEFVFTLDPDVDPSR